MQPKLRRIDTDIPVPIATRGRQRELPYLEMKPGHSFAAPRYVDVKRFKVPSDWEFMCRKEKNGDGYRIWRTK